MLLGDLERPGIWHPSHGENHSGIRHEELTAGWGRNSSRFLGPSKVARGHSELTGQVG